MLNTDSFSLTQSMSKRQTIHNHTLIQGSGSERGHVYSGNFTYYSINENKEQEKINEAKA